MSNHSRLKEVIELVKNEPVEVAYPRIYHVYAELCLEYFRKHDPFHPVDIMLHDAIQGTFALVTTHFDVLMKEEDVRVFLQHFIEFMRVIDEKYSLEEDGYKKHPQFPKLREEFQQIRDRIKKLKEYWELFSGW